jgi:hypothetical protein
MNGIPFMVTQAMKAALHARGLTDEEIMQLVPEKAHEILTTPDKREIREFVETIAAQARAATKGLSDPGVWQMVLVHPATDSVETIYRYALDDPNLVERMTSDAVNASEAGHNVYIEARTVRRGLGAKQRGGLKDTVAVFALVVDSDIDKGKAWTPTVPVSLVVETSPGNAHDWFFLEQAVDAPTGQALGERLRAVTNADADTGNVCQPYRVAGTTNYPGKKKQERGRIVTWTRSLGFDPDTLWTPERFEAEFPAAPKPTDGGGNGAGTASEAHIPADTLREIQSQDPGKRGTRFWNVMIVLKSLGYTINGIVALFEKYPDGIAAKYRGRLRHQVETVWAKLNIGEPKPTTDITVIKVQSQADFLAGFVPPDYLVDGVLQRRFVYSLTAQTGHGKTALALLLARAIITLHHSDKFRGPGFEPITFKLEKITTDKLVDGKKRQIPTVHAVAITGQEEEEQEANAEREEDELLAALTGKKALSIADLARACDWKFANGEPYKSKVQRVLGRLKSAKPALVKQERNRRWALTEEGRKAAGVDDEEDDETERTVEDRSGAPGKKPFHALRGMKQRPTVPCAYCGTTGEVYKIADGRQPKGQRRHADLHAGCAEAFFTGQPKPDGPAESVH